MKYKNLFFDLDDTIWAFSQNARNTFEEVYQKYSFDRYFDSFNHYYTLYQQRNTELWVEYGEGKITKDELNSQRFFYPLQAVGVKDEALAERFSRDFFAIILLPNITSISFPMGFVNCNHVRCVRQEWTGISER